MGAELNSSCFRFLKIIEKLRQIYINMKKRLANFVEKCVDIPEIDLFKIDQIRKNLKK